MYDHGGMNRFFRLVWSDAKGCYIPIPEVSQKRGKRKGGAFALLAAMALLAGAGKALADPGSTAAHVQPVMHGAAPQSIAPNMLPTGGQVVGGNATITTSGNTQTITQTSQNAAIDWQSFNIGADGKVIFNQPSTSAIALNRVIGGDASQIYGALQANGQVFLVNPNGMLFAKGSQVSAAAILASTRDISVADFMAGKYHFSGTGAGTIVNEGQITAGAGGFIALVGAQVVNDGTLSAAQGDVHLVAANDVTVRLDTGGLDLTIGQGAYDALVDNGGVIQADSGRIYLTAQALDALTRASVNNSGIVEASSITNVGGKIVLSGDDITLAGGSKLDASGALGGGSVFVGGGWQGGDAAIANASTVAMADAATIDVSAVQSGNGGTAVLWSQDRTDFSGHIDAAGPAGGGKVETSSHNLLNVTGAVDAHATGGPAGQWLLDPYNVIIATSGASGTAYGANYNPATDSVILASSIAGSLSSANVTITTGSSGSSAGNITVNAPITRTSGYTTQTLTLKAANDININKTISSTTGALNVVLMADSDNTSVGNINFGSTGKILTNGGNFYAGSLAGYVNSKGGQNFTMAAGSQVDVGTGGFFDIEMNGTVSLDANSLVFKTGGTPYYNDGVNPYTSAALTINAGAIVSTNTSATTPDILSRVATSLTASSGDIGSASNPLKISAGDPVNDGIAYQTLNVSNSGGSTWINEIDAQLAYSINLSIGTQLNSQHHINLLGDADGTGQGHIDATTDGSGVVQVATGGIKTGGDYDDNTGEGLYPTNLTLSGTTIHFADNAVDSGTASLTVNATTIKGTSDNVADIVSGNLTLNGGNIGTSSDPLELADNYYDTYDGYWQGGLTVNNSGGGTYLKVVNDGYGYLTLDYAKAAGTHSILFSGGDHIDFTTNGSAIVTPTLSGGASDGQTFGATTGIDLSRGFRNLTLNAQNGNIVLGDTSILMGAAQLSYGTYYNTVLTLGIDNGNATGIIAAQNSYNSSSPVAQITAGDVTLSAQNYTTPSVTSFGMGGKDIQIAETAGARNSTLTVNTYQGSVSVHELTDNYFKNISVSMGDAETTQTVAIDLKGADDISFADNGSQILVDPTKVNVSSGNRSFSLSASARTIQENGNSATTGSYSLYGKYVKLNGDVVTDGGNISLSGPYGLTLMKSVLVDSNSDHLGDSGTINVSSDYYSYSGSVSATGAGQTLTLDSHSTDGLGGNISVGSRVDNRGGAYLAGLAINATSAGTGQDGTVNIGGNVYLNGNFSAYGATTVGYYNDDFTLQTDVSNVGNAGNIIFGGDSLAHGSDHAATFNASTSASGGNGGNVDLFTSTASTEFDATTVTVVANAGTGGTKGAVTLGAVTTTGNQGYSGASITLYGDLSTGGNALTLAGPVYVTRDLTLSTGSGAMSLGTLSATTTGVDLTIGSTSDSSAITLNADNGGGAYLNSLAVQSTTGRQVNLGNLTTEGAQTYSGGAIRLGGSLSTNGGTIDLSGAGSLTVTGSSIAIDTDRAGGTNAAGQLKLGTFALNGGAGTLSIDTTADGGGANAALTLNGVGNSTAFSSINIASGALTANGTVKATGNVTMEARGTGADLTIASTGKVQTTGTSNTVILAAGRNFLNNASSNTGIGLGAGSRYLVYSSDPSASTEGMTGYSKHYNQGYTIGSNPSYASSGNWFLYTIAPVITVAPTTTSIVYGSADPTVTLGASNYSGFIDGDSFASLSGSQTLSLAAAGTLSGAGKRQVGTYAYTLNGTVSDSLGYQYAAFSGNLDVTKASIAVTGLTAANRAYDGTTNVTLTGTASAGSALSGDQVTVDASAITGSILDANAGNGKAVVISGSGGLTGTDAGNYQLTPPSGLTMNVTRKTLTVTGSTATGKTYDASLSDTINIGTLSGFVGLETVSATAAGAFTDANAGTGKTVTATYTLADGTNGGLASNYQLANDSLSADIAKKTLTIGGSSVTGKTYDASNTATIVAGTLSGLVGSQTLSVAGAGAFADANAGIGQSVTTTYTLSNGTNGGLAGNYQLAGETLSGDIARKTLTISGSTVAGKTYDASNTATITAGTLSGFVGSETVTAAAGGTFANANAGTGKTVTATYTLSNGTNGGLAGNYQLAGQSLSGDIAKKTLTISGSTVAGKTYDATTTATITAGTLSGLVGSQTLSVAGAGSFADANAGTGKTVATTYTLSNGTNGALAGNYQLAGQSLSGDIAKKTLTISGSTVAGKTYDATTTATVTAGTLSGLVGSQTLSVSGSGAFADKNAGTGKSVAATYTLGNGTNGGLAGNYQLAGETLLGNIAKKTLSLTTTGQNKTYDGSDAIVVAVSSTGVLTGDSVAFSGTGEASDKNAGNGKTVAVSNITASGGDAGNYAFATTGSTTANIARKTITVTASGDNKTYDGSALVGVELSSNGIVSGDDLTFSGTGTASDKTAGTGKTVTIGGFAAAGADAGNYAVTAPVSTTVDIAQKIITVAATGENKTYDGSASVGVDLSSGGLVAGDTVAFTGTGTASDKNAGTGKTVTVANITASGSDAGNYAFAATGSTTVDIAKKSITVAATGENKTYDGSASVGVDLSSGGLVAGDDLTFSGSGTASDKNAGTGKTVTVSNITASGSDAGNYAFASTGSATVDIARKTITVAAIGENKTYDGSASVGVGLSSGDLVAGDTVAFSGTGEASDKNAGQGKTVAVSGITASGQDAGNYAFASTGSTTVDIARKTITVAATGGDKTYDGSAMVGVDLSSNGLVAGDTVTFAGTGTASDKNAGQDKTVTVSNITASGQDAGNYAFASTGSTTVDIARKTITVAAIGDNKTYDGSASVGVDLSSNGLVAGDTVAFTGTGTASDKNAGTGKTVAVSNIAASGQDAGNYAFAATGSATVDIAKKTITVAAIGDSKTYDGSASVGVDLSSNGLVAGDTVAFAGTGTASDKNAGAGKTVTVSNITASGGDAGNYAFATTGSATVDIARKTITVAAIGDNKTYDGSASVGVDLSSSGLVAGDAVTFAGSGTASDKNAGQGKTVAVSGITANGADAGNYAFASTAATTVDIATKAINVTLQGPISKTGDGSTSVTLSSVNYQVAGLVSGDTMTVNQTVGTFADATAGKGKTVTALIGATNYVAGANTSLGNYTLASFTLTSTVGEITSPTSPGYNSALSSVTPPVVVTPPPAISTGDSGNSVATSSSSSTSSGTSSQTASITPVDSHETLTFRRAFSVVDGGIHLPDGVSDGESDTSKGQ